MTGKDKMDSPSRSLPGYDGPSAASVGSEPSAGVKFGRWTISFDPPPIPIRTMDWQFYHENYDASWEGEEDGYVSNGLGGYGASVEDCIAQIVDIEEDKGMPLTVAA